MNSLVLVTVSLNLSFFIFLISSSVEIIFIIFIKSSLFRSFKNSSNISSFDFVFFGLPEPLPFYKAIFHSLILCSIPKLYLLYLFTESLSLIVRNVFWQFFIFIISFKKHFLSEFPRSNIFRIFQTNISIH